MNNIKQYPLLKLSDVSKIFTSTGFLRVLKEGIERGDMNTFILCPDIYIPGEMAVDLVEANGLEKGFAVFPQNSIKALKQVEQLRADGRVDYFAEANYSRGTTTYNWLMKKIKNLADKLIQAEKNKLVLANSGPQHIVK